MRKLTLARETLTELTPAELTVVIGGGETQSCPITYTCVNISNTCQISNGCINITNNCTSRVPGGC